MTVPQFNSSSLHELSALASDPCVSILMPTERRAPSQKEAHARLKNLTRAARQGLESRGYGMADAAAFVAPIAALDREGDLWRDRNAGLAVFVSTGCLRVFVTPMTLPELAVVASHFYLKPLIRLLTAYPKIFVLALSQSQVRLFEHDVLLDTANLVELPHIHTGIQEVTPHEGLDTQRQSKSFVRSIPGGTTRGHSHGAGDIQHKDKLLRYVQLINKDVVGVLGDSCAPLVLAGVDYELALYRQVNTYPHVSTQVISGNPDQKSAQALAKASISALEAEAEEERDAAVAEYKSLRGTPRVTRTFKDIVRFAHTGRVQVLFAAQDVEKWGHFNPKIGHVRPRSQPQPGYDGLISLTAENTLLHRGRVFLMPRSTIPNHASMAAVLRF